MAKPRWGCRGWSRERPEVRTDYALNEGAAERLELADGRTVVTINVGEKGALRGDRDRRRCGRPDVAAVVGRKRRAAAGSADRPAVAALPRPRLLPQTDAMLTALVGAEGELAERIARADALHPMLPDLIAPLFVTTVAPTRLHGSTALNVMPAEASVDCDCRPIPGATDRRCARRAGGGAGRRHPLPDRVLRRARGRLDLPARHARCTRSAASGWRGTIPTRC